MSPSSIWGIRPQDSIAIEVGRRGHKSFIDGCIAILRDELVDSRLLVSLGGPGASKFLSGEEQQDVYWLKVWAIRGLLWEWDDVAIFEIGRALSDESWRVREMALRVIAKYKLAELLPNAIVCKRDPVARVQSAAARAEQATISSVY